jgi:phosphate transport system substrate-binding protein
MPRLVALSLLTLFVLGAPGNSPVFGQAMLDPNLPVYRPVASLQGELNLAGSNTMSHVAATWADSFRQFYPDVTINITITGSREAVTTVQGGTAHIGLLSRSITADEVAAFQAAKGHAPQVLTPCSERIAIYVHKDNPIRGLTLEQVDGIFSTTCQRGAKEPIRTWGQLGFPGAWATQPVMARGRSGDTGSQVYIQEAVLLGGEFRKDMADHPDNLSLLDAITNDPRSVGFAGLCYDNPNVRTVPIAIQAGTPHVAVDSAEADAGQYPLLRPLQLVVDPDPAQPLPAAEAEFIKYVFSRLGQEDVIKSGFQPIPSRPANIALDSVGLGIAR